MQLVKAHTNLGPAEVQELQGRGRRLQLARVLKVTERMLQHADAGEWDALEELEAVRRIELEECFHLQLEQPDELVAEALATLIHLNDRLVHIVRHARTRMAADYGTEARSFNAVRAYSGELQ